MHGCLQGNCKIYIGFTLYTYLPTRILSATEPNTECVSAKSIAPVKCKLCVDTDIFCIKYIVLKFIINSYIHICSGSFFLWPSGAKTLQRTGYRDSNF